MIGEILVYERGPVTADGNKPVVTKTTVWQGNARIQPMRTPRGEPEPGDRDVIQQVLFSVPLSAPVQDFKPRKHYVQVLNGGLNDALVGAVMTVHEVADSSNPIERTFVAEWDTDNG